MSNDIYNIINEMRQNEIKITNIQLSHSREYIKTTIEKIDIINDEITKTVNFLIKIKSNNE